MDVLIKDSSLPPTNCYGCRFFKEEHYKDVFQDREYDVIGECLAGEFQIEKPYSPYDGICPLIEVEEAKIGVVYPTESKMWVEASTEGEETT